MSCDFEYNMHMSRGRCFEILLPVGKARSGNLWTGSTYVISQSHPSPQRTALTLAHTRH